MVESLSPLLDLLRAGSHYNKSVTSATVMIQSIFDRLSQGGDGGGRLERKLSSRGVEKSRR